MKRRAFLVGAGSALGTTTAGCLGAPRPDGRTDRPGGSTDPPDDGTTTDDGAGGDADPRVDEPPYPIERPEPPDDPMDPDDWNELYRCEQMPAEPTIDFEQLAGARLAEPTHLADYRDADEAYSVRVLADADARDAVLDLSGSTDRARERLTGLDFEQQAVLVVESGFGSGSIDHHWKRLEGGAELHLHGCHTDPYVQTDDVTARGSVVVVDRPATEFDLVRVSLTVSADRRVHFNSTEGVVAL